MKKIVIILAFSVIAIVLMSLGFTRNQSDEIDLVYNVDSRYNNTLSESVILEAKSIVDLIPDQTTKEQVAVYKEVQVSILNQNLEKSNKVDGLELSESQLEILKNIKSSDDILVEAKYNIDGFPSDYILTYYMTVLPEVEAKYENGQDELINYLKSASSSFVKSVKKENLKPGRIGFTVTKEGLITDVGLESTSGYPKVDKELIKVIQTIPNNWTPAKDINGEPVDQKLIFFFGMQGC